MLGNSIQSCTYTGTQSTYSSIAYLFGAILQNQKLETCHDWKLLTFSKSFTLHTVLLTYGSNGMLCL